MRAVAASLLFALVSLLVGCGPKWTIVHQATPNPFGPSSPFHVEKPTFQGLMVGDKPEAAYLAQKDPTAQGSFLEDKQGMVAAFSEGFDAEKGALRLALPGEAFVVRTNVAFLEPGYYAGIVSSPSRVRADVKLLDAQGQLLDAITVEAVGPASALTASSGQRLRRAAELVGRLAAAYLKERAGLD